MVLASLLIGERFVESWVGCSQFAVGVVVVKIEEESSLVLMFLGFQKWKKGDFFSSCDH